MPAETPKVDAAKSASTPTVEAVPAAVHSSGPSSDVGASASDVNKMSAEEQLARFAEALKEADWGHQPC